MEDLLYSGRRSLSFPDAAAHLSLDLVREVTGADVYRMVLDRELTLSIDLRNTTYSWIGKVVPPEQAKDRVAIGDSG